MGLCLCTLCIPLFAQANNEVNLANIPSIKPVLLATKTQDASLFTQGLVLDGDITYLSGGLYGQSRLVKESSIQRKTRSLPKSWFAEGITIIDQNLFLLTWKRGILAIFNKDTLEQLDTLNYHGEGWGLTSNGKQLMMSNGSNQILFRHLEDFSIQRSLVIPGLDKLNELEYVDKVIWANRWYDDHIYAIDVDSGCILSKMNLQPFRQQAVKFVDNKNVTNGIGYDPKRHGLWVTGKLWSKRFLIKYPDLSRDHC